MAILPTSLSGITTTLMLGLKAFQSTRCVSSLVLRPHFVRPGSSISSGFLSSRSFGSNTRPDSRTSFVLKRCNTQRLKLQEQSGGDDETKKATSQNEDYQNKNNIRDQIVAAISSNGEIKVTAATTRNLVNDVMIMQTLTTVPADALGRSMTCGLLLSNGMQDEQTFQLTMACDGPIRTVVSIAESNGSVRGYVGNPSLNAMSLPEAIGQGTVQIVKNHPSWPNPYNGVTSIRTGDIDRDVGIYLAESEQRSCALAAGTTLSPNGILCTAAGGYVVEQLPGCTEETVRLVEKNLGELVESDGSGVAPTGLLSRGETPWDICNKVLDGLGAEPLVQMEPKFTCNCSEERLFRAVRLLPKKDIDEILKTEEKLEARCDFCGKVYRMGPDEVAARYNDAVGDPSLDSDFEKGEEK